MTVSEGPATSKQKEVKKRYPVTTGKTLGTTKISGRDPYLRPVGIGATKSLISSSDKLGAYGKA